MKYSSLYFIIFLLCLSNSIDAQICTPQVFNQPGIYPEPSSFSCIEQGVFFSDVIHIYEVDSLPGALPFPVDSITMDSIVNLPCGLNWVASPSTTWSNLQNACVTISGTTNDPIGQYDVEIYITYWYPLPLGAFAFNLADLYDRYDVRVVSSIASCPPIDTSILGLGSSCNAGALTVTASSNTNQVCVGDSARLFANAAGGSKSYSYSWSPVVGLSDPFIRNPKASPSSTTNYTVTVNDGVNSATSYPVVINMNNCNPAGPGCVPVSQGAKGMYPNAEGLPCIQQGVYYDEVIQIQSMDSLLNIFGVPSGGLAVDSVSIHTILNLPCGIEWSPNTTRSWSKGEAGCIRIYGTTNDSVGQYKLHFYLNFVAAIFGSVDSFPFQNPEYRYDLRVVDNPSNCPPIDTFNIGLGSTCNAPPFFTQLRTISPVALCQGESLQLEVQAIGGNNNYSYSWSPTAGLSNGNIANPIASPTVTTTYTVTVSDGVNTSTETVELFVQQCPTGGVCNSIPFPEGGIYPKDPNDLPCIEPGVPYEQTIVLQAWFPSGQVPTYDGVIIDSINNLPCGLTWSTSKANTTPPNWFQDNEVGCITICGVTNDPPGQYDLEFWMTDKDGLVNQPLPGIAYGIGYTIRVGGGTCPVIDTSQQGMTASCKYTPGPCSVSGSNLTASVSVGEDTICTGNSTNFTTSVSGGAGNYTYSWSPVDGLSDPNVANPVVTPDSTTTYVLTINDGVTTITAISTIVVRDSAIVNVGVYDDQQNLIPNAKVLLIEFNSTDSSVYAIDSSFLFVHTFVGRWNQLFVKAIPDPVSYPNLLPTYHASSPVVSGAKMIDASGCPVYNAMVRLVVGQNPGGPGFIGGLISQGAGKQMGPGDPVENLELVLVNSSNEPVTTGKTNSDGYFEFNNLALGTYKIWVDKPGIDNNLAPVILLTTGNNEQQDSLQFELFDNSLEQVFGVGVQPVASDFNWDIYPNPANDMVQINIVSAGEVQFALSIFNTNGVNVLNREIQTSGTFTGNIDVNELPQGIYIVKLQSDRGVLIRKLAVH